MELAYDLIGLKAGDEVITTSLTCTATNIPLVRRGVNIIFADIDTQTLTISDEDIRRKITGNTKAIVVVDSHGIMATRGPFYAESNGVLRKLPIVVDASQALGNFSGDFTVCSFQAIKHLTTCDGGMLVCHSDENYKTAKTLTLVWHR